MAGVPSKRYLFTLRLAAAAPLRPPLPQAESCPEGLEIIISTCSSSPVDASM